MLDNFFKSKFNIILFFVVNIVFIFLMSMCRSGASNLSIPFFERSLSFYGPATSPYLFNSSSNPLYIGFTCGLNEDQSKYDKYFKFGNFEGITLPVQPDTLSKTKYVSFNAYLPNGANGLKFNVVNTIPSSPLYYSTSWYVLFVKNESESNGTDYKQTALPWSDDIYGNHKYKKIRNLGCNLCCAASIATDKGMSITPRVLNNALNQEPDGYGKSKSGYKVLVNPVAVCRVVNRMHPYSSYMLITKSYIPTDQCLLKGLGVTASVKNVGHWVRPVRFWGTNGDDFYINDPMGVTNRYKEYYGTNSKNTRVYYLIPKIPKVNNIASLRNSKTFIEDQYFETSSLSISEYQFPPQVGQSGVCISTLDDNYTFELQDSNGNKIGESAPNNLEDDDVQENTVEEIETNNSLFATDMNNGSYKIIIRGEKGGEYNLKMFSYDIYGDIKQEQTFAGYIGSNDISTVNFEHHTLVWLPTLADYSTLPEGTEVLISRGQTATAQLESGFYIQSTKYRTPSMYVKSLSKIKIGYGVNDLYGVIKIDPVFNKKYLSLYSMGVQNSNPDFIAAMGCVPSRIRTTNNLYVRTWGRITDTLSSGFTIDNILKVKYNVSSNDYRIGDWVMIEGVYNEFDSAFYASSVKT
jgi:hypothetical protein